MTRPHRQHPLWYAYLLHRVSGLLLTLFLPVHFWVLAKALTDRAGRDGFLAWTADPLVKFAEWGLVFLLGVHFFGGLRLLVLEFTPWQPWQKSWVAAATAAGFVVSTVFFLQTI